MRVVATREGYHGRVRKPGEVFEVPEGSPLGRWMLDATSAEGMAYIAGTRGVSQKNERDRLTGERLAAGGIAEQLAVALEEGRRLRERVAELEAELQVHRDRSLAAASSVKVEAPHPAQTGADEEKPVEVAQRVRRRATSGE